MTGKTLMHLSEYDIRFIVETVDINLMGKLEVIKDDREILDRMLDMHAEDLFRRINYAGTGILSRVTPRLLFEILLRKTSQEIGNKSYIMERTATRKIPVFDTQEVCIFLHNKDIQAYLAEMLDSFTRTESFTLRVRVRKGIWRKIRYSDMDIRSLRYMCECVDEEHRFKFYKRIGDLCLFTLGMFPEYAMRDGNSLQSGMLLQHSALRKSISYQEEGKRFYGLAAKHEAASLLGLSQLFNRLYEDFDLATRPLNYISEHYLQFKKQQLFPGTVSG